VSYKILTPEGIEVIRPLLLSKSKIGDLHASSAIIGRGDLVDEIGLKELAGKVRALQSGLEKSGEPLEDLDRLCFPLVHEFMDGVSDAAGDPRFWIWFATSHLADVIYKRFPPRKTKTNPTGNMNLDNFGIGKRGECWPYKLWVRGELSKNESCPSNPYELGTLGSIDLWTSHVHRQQFMSVRPFFRSVMNLQYPKKLKGKPLLWEGQEQSGKPGFRTLIKRLRENWASVEYVFLSDSDAERLVIEHSKGLYLSDGKVIR